MGALPCKHGRRNCCGCPTVPKTDEASLATKQMAKHPDSHPRGEGNGSATPARTPNPLQAPGGACPSDTPRAGTQIDSQAREFEVKVADLPGSQPNGQNILISISPPSPPCAPQANPSRQGGNLTIANTNNLVPISSEGLRTPTVTQPPKNFEASVLPPECSLVEMEEEVGRREISRQETRDVALLCREEHPCGEGFLASAATEKSLLLLIIDSYVYDATSFVSEHPGGSYVIKQNVGKECGDVFRSIHGRRAKEMLKSLLVGKCLESSPFLTPASSFALLNGDTLLDAADRDKVGKGTAEADRHQARLLSSDKRTSDVWYLTFASPEEIHLHPGGHLSIVIPKSPPSPGAIIDVSSQPNSLEEEEIRRNYTPFIVEATSFTICVRMYPKGLGSTYLTSLNVGDEITFTGPILPSVSLPQLLSSSPTPASHILLIAGGTGIAPIFTIAKDLIEANQAERSAIEAGQRDPIRVTVMGCFRTRQDILLGDELTALIESSRVVTPVASGPPDHAMRLIYVFSRESAEIAANPPAELGSALTLVGHLNADHLRELMATDFAVICGPPELNRAAVGAIAETKLCWSSNVYCL